MRFILINFVENSKCYHMKDFTFFGVDQTCQTISGALTGLKCWVCCILTP